MTANDPWFWRGMTGFMDEFLGKRSRLARRQFGANARGCRMVTRKTRSRILGIASIANIDGEDRDLLEQDATSALLWAAGGRLRAGQLKEDAAQRSQTRAILDEHAGPGEDRSCLCDELLRLLWTEPSHDAVHGALDARRARFVERPANVPYARVRASPRFLALLTCENETRLAMPRRLDPVGDVVGQHRDPPSAQTCRKRIQRAKFAMERWRRSIDLNR